MGGNVRVCVARSADVLAEGDDVGLAGEAALARRSAFRDARDGDDHVAARILVRLLLAASLPGARPAGWEVTQRCEDPRCRRSEPHGRPRARLVEEGAGGVRVAHGAVSVSWSHASGVIAAAVGLGVGRVGVDAEPVRPEPPLPGRTWRSWVRAEALVKAGHGDLDGMLGLALDDEPGCAPVPRELGSAGWLCDIDTVIDCAGVVVAVASGAAARPSILEMPLESLPGR